MKLPALRTKSVLKLVMKGNENRKFKDLQTCCLCRKKLSNRTTLANHLQNSHHKGTPMFCDLCPKVFYSKMTMKSHMRLHGRGKVFRCNICDYQTFYEKGLREHKARHEKKESCKICDKPVLSLKIHMSIAHLPKFACPICHKEMNEKGLKSHIENHRIARYSCIDCSEAFSSKKELKRHELKKHYNGKVYECHCGSTYRELYLLKAHQISHESYKITCEICEKAFDSRWKFKRHWNVNHSKTHGEIRVDLTTKTIKIINKEGPFICDKCGFMHQIRNKFTSHMNQHPKSPRYFCDLCPASYDKKYVLRQHMKDVHLQLRPLECDFCGFTAKRKQALRSHILTHFPPPKTKCEICLKSVSNLVNHLETHVKVDCPTFHKSYSKRGLPGHKKKCGIVAERRKKIFEKQPNSLLYPVVVLRRLDKRTLAKYLKKESSKMFCDLCPKFYFDKSEIRHHLITTHGEKAFTCNICYYKASTENVMRRHKLKHELNERCELCHKDVSLLRNHLKLAHTPRETCPICGKKLSKRHLKGHIERHGDKKYKCTDCNEAFDRRQYLKRHKLKTHYEKRIYECHCKAVFTQKNKLNHHQKLKHIIKNFECSVCKQQLATKYTLIQHWKFKHLKDHGPLQMIFPSLSDKPTILEHDKPFICDMCGNKLTNRRLFINHIYYRHRKVRFYCDHCPISFCVKRQIETHLKAVHYKVHPFKCHICGHSTSTESCLKSHMLQHVTKKRCKICKKLVANMDYHLKNHEKKTCPICGVSIRKANLRAHIEVHKKKVNSCKTCKQTFLNHRELRRHILKAHSNCELYECHCGDVFDTAMKLKKHEVMHEPPIFCKICKISLNPNAFRTHQYRKHREMMGKPRKTRKR